MSSQSNPAIDPENQIANVPNALSLIRLILAVFVGFLIEWGYFIPAMWVFVFAASTDFVDGWWARKFNQVTKVGRILDPFVDKIIITAALVALAAHANSQIAPWIATVIIGREFLVTSIRAMVEGQGGDFSARWMGKWKMVLQCAAIVASLLLLDVTFTGQWLTITTIALVWAALLLTVLSGADYVVQAFKIFRVKSVS